MNTLAIFGAIIAAAVTALGMVVVAKLQSRSTPFGDMASALRDERERGDRQDKRIDDLDERLRLALRRIDLMDGDMGILIDDLAAQESWQTTGALLPPPPISARALTLLRKHRQIRRDTPLSAPVTPDPQPTTT